MYLPIRLLAVLCCGALAAQRPASPVQWFPAAGDAAAPAPWAPFLQTSTMAAGRYRLAKGAADGQSPHDRDELYFVLAGAAKLQAGNETRAVAAGDAVFVAAHVPHRFLDVEQDLDVLVFFSKAKPAAGGMAAGPRPTEQTPYDEASQRGNARVFYWFGPDSAGQFCIDFGRPAWQPGFAKFVETAGGPRWRFGENHWTTLDTNMELEIGGVAVPIGQWYCVLQNDKDARMQLVLLDPQEVRKRRLDAYEAPMTSGGITIPLALARSEHVASSLDVVLAVDRAQRDRATLSIRFGPYVLTAPVLMRPR